MNSNWKKSPYKLTTKKDVAKMMGVCARTLRYYLNVRYFERLVFWGDYTKEQKHLTRRQIFILDDHCNLDFWE